MPGLCTTRCVYSEMSGALIHCYETPLAKSFNRTKHSRSVLVLAIRRRKSEGPSICGLGSGGNPAVRASFNRSSWEFLEVVGKVGGQKEGDEEQDNWGAMAGGRVLVTFDVDGTLMQVQGDKANFLHKEAFSFAFKEVFGIVGGSIDVIKHHGSTDPLVLVDTLEYYGIPRETSTAKLPELKAKMLEYARNNSTQVTEGLELLPGVPELLQTLSNRKDAVIGLVTGNLDEIAWLKMQGLGIRPLFSNPNFGGFGSDNSDRGELVKIAASRAQTLFPGDFSLRVHVGDTPNDIRAAEYAGAQAIGVCTGVFGRDELLAASDSGEAIILDNLSDIRLFFKACGLEEP